MLLREHQKKLVAHMSYPIDIIKEFHPNLFVINVKKNLHSRVLSVCVTLGVHVGEMLLSCPEALVKSLECRTSQPKRDGRLCITCCSKPYLIYYI